MNIPTTRFRIGDSVTVKCDVEGDPPSYNAFVTGMKVVKGPFGAIAIIFQVTEDDGSRTDGYTEDWLSERSK